MRGKRIRDVGAMGTPAAVPTLTDTPSRASRWAPGSASADLASCRPGRRPCRPLRGSSEGTGRLPARRLRIGCSPCRERCSSTRLPPSAPSIESLLKRHRPCEAGGGAGTFLPRFLLPKLPALSLLPGVMSSTRHLRHHDASPGRAGIAVFPTLEYPELLVCLAHSRHATYTC